MHYFRTIKQGLINLNLFDDDTNDHYEKRNQILSTRSYIIVFVMILFIFILYTSLSSQTTTIRISKPTLNQYVNLYEKHSNKLQCPCKNISISYEIFLSIEPTFHPICLSNLIDQNWIQFLSYENISYYFQLDFRQTASMRFQILRTLCGQAQEQIENNLIEFYSTQLLTLELLSNQTFSIQIISVIETFQRTILVSFQNLITLFRTMTRNNQLYSALDASHWFLFSFDNSIGSITILESYIFYYELFTDSSVRMLDCYVDNSTTNQLPGGIYAHITKYDYAGSFWMQFAPHASTSMINATTLIPGIMVSCSPVESLIQSTMECFFNETCLNTIISYITHPTISLNSISILNSSRFLSNTTVGTLMNELFVEKWINNVSYTQYFNQCQPLYCEYSIEKRRGILYIFTLVLSLYGGLTIVLRTLIPIVIKVIYKKKQQVVAEDTPTVNGKFRIC